MSQWCDHEKKECVTLILTLTLTLTLTLILTLILTLTLTLTTYANVVRMGLNRLSMLSKRLRCVGDRELTSKRA